MKVVRIKKGHVEILEIEKTLEGYYKALKCNYIDIIPLKINNKTYDFIIDDEAKFKSHYPNILLSNKDNKIVDYIANDVIICNSIETEDGLDEDELTDLDIKNIKRWVATCEKRIDLKCCVFSLVLKI